MGGQRHALTTLPPGSRRGTYCTGRMVGPRAGLDGCAKSRFYRDSIPGASAPSGSLYPVYRNRYECILPYLFMRISQNLTAINYNQHGDVNFAINLCIECALKNAIQ
jgi:hypothetical protein